MFIFNLMGIVLKLTFFKLQYLNVKDEDAIRRYHPKITYGIT